MSDHIGIPPDWSGDPGEDLIGTLSSADPWHMPSSVWQPIWDSGIDGETIRVAVLDTGVVSHPDLPEPIAKRSFIRGESVDDRNAHGTHCSGSAVGRNGIGVAPKADLIIGKVLSNSGSGGSDGIAAGIEWAIDEGADVISLSLGGGPAYRPTEVAIDRAYSRGCLVVAAAGNSGRNNNIGNPAAYRGCLCTGATRPDGGIAGFSDNGPQMDWSCPGVDIVSASIRGGRVQMSGTSMATPHGAGILALIVQLMRRAGSPHWTAVDSVREFFKLHLMDRGSPGWDPHFGHGFPDYQKIIAALTDPEAWI